MLHFFKWILFNFHKYQLIVIICVQQRIKFPSFQTNLNKRQLNLNKIAILLNLLHQLILFSLNLMNQLLLTYPISFKSIVQILQMVLSTQALEKHFRALAKQPVIHILIYQMEDFILLFLMRISNQQLLIKIYKLQSCFQLRLELCTKQKALKKVNTFQVFS
ncbi:hypothetical protein TTHERM_000497757 (macronuclear) [Tetrahymena thermophila SB210]|uniref:Uncharacterized protein n=1 Tax=Tetrahymena thermophila (strain SB210) TaxID=312017 RepID=W7X3F4_TETTS|nr:hypothetical protein TTHERM_000497757 [Tetrahymena thermophila SB210]EWS70958.1 hypothetical protein TTHERM_000497757 [Tetrahymena thermophila SB210]|eukprot:XP_012656514.1 hypothetical protein TTHERM_000497757 [Tetrahymena thermophila SB210]